MRAALPPGSSTSANVAYAVVPLVAGLPQPVKDETRHAFAAALVPVWRMLIGVTGAGLIAALPMRGLPLHTMRDESYAIKVEEREKSVDEAT